jgi:hypothetical protein
MTLPNEHIPARINDQDAPATFTYLNPHTQLLEIVDVKTGKPIAIQRSMEDIATHHRDKLVKHELPDGSTIFLEKGLNPDHVAYQPRAYNVSKLVIEVICQKIAEGGSLTKICKQPSMPSYAIFSRWRRENPWIEEMIGKARLDRAEYMRDLALDEAIGASEDEVGAHRLRVDTFKWAASIDDAAKYSPKTKVQAEITSPLQIMVSTGIIRREEEAHGSDILQAKVHQATDSAWERPAVECDPTEGGSSPD